MMAAMIALSFVLAYPIFMFLIYLLAKIIFTPLDKVAADQDKERRRVARVCARVARAKPGKHLCPGRALAAGVGAVEDTYAAVAIRIRRARPDVVVLVTKLPAHRGSHLFQHRFIDQETIRSIREMIASTLDQLDLIFDADCRREAREQNSTGPQYAPHLINHCLPMLFIGCKVKHRAA